MNQAKPGVIYDRRKARFVVFLLLLFTAISSRFFSLAKPSSFEHNHHPTTTLTTHPSPLYSTQELRRRSSASARGQDMHQSTNGGTNPATQSGTQVILSCMRHNQSEPVISASWDSSWNPRQTRDSTTLPYESPAATHGSNAGYLSPARRLSLSTRIL
jgi:hypothetical protein